MAEFPYRPWAVSLNRTKVVLLAALSWLAIASFFGTIPAAASNSHKRVTSQPVVPDPDYVYALAAANRFLYAWQMGDLENGMVLLSDHVRHSQNAEKVEQLFAATSTRSYEIARGKGNRGRYSFAVVLVSSAGAKARRRLCEIIVVNAGKNDWVVDKLP